MSQAGFYSFARVVQSYRRKIGGTGHKARIVEIEQDAAGDLDSLFHGHNWVFFERQRYIDLWGKDTVTITSETTNSDAEESLITVSDTWEDKWLGQDLSFSGATGTHVIKRKNNNTSFIIHPHYGGSSAVASGTTGTIRQKRIQLPNNFAKIHGPVTLNGDRECTARSPEEMDRETLGGDYSSTFIYTIRGNDWGKFMEIYPDQSGRLYFRYSAAPDYIFVYSDGKAYVEKDCPKAVKFSSAADMAMLPNSGREMVFETQDSVIRGFPYWSDTVSVNDEKTEIALATDWKGPFDTWFDYYISSKLDLPPYLSRAMRGYADFYADKIDEGTLSRYLVKAKADDKKDINYTGGHTYRTRWTSAVESGGTTWLIGYP